MIPDLTSLQDIAKVWPFGAILAIVTLLLTWIYCKIYRPEVIRRSEHDAKMAEIHEREIKSMSSITEAQKNLTANLALVSQSQVAAMRIMEGQTNRLEKVADRMEANERRR